MLVNNRVRGGMRAAEITQREPGLNPRPGLARGPVTGDERTHDVHGRLVHRDPEADLACEPRGDALHVSLKEPDAIGSRPSTAMCEPRRIREVMERDDRFETARLQCAHHGDVVIQSYRIEVPFAGLDPAPFDGKTVRVVAPGTGKIEVAFIPLEMAARVSRAIRQASGLFELPPVIPPVVAFDLVTRGGRPPEEAGGKAKPSGVRVPQTR